MNAANIAIGLVILVLFAVAIRSVIRHLRSGDCCGKCGGGSCCCNSPECATATRLKTAKAETGAKKRPEDLE